MRFFQSFRFRLRYTLMPLLCLILTFYFGYHALNGEHGLRRMFQLKQELKIARQIADEIRMRRMEMEARVKQLSPESIDADVLDESARSILNMGDENDYIIFDNE